MPNKTILVTGGAGFIGSHLCGALVGRGDRVICLDSLVTGAEKNVSGLTVALFRFIEHDIVDPLEINEWIDEIYNLACPASPVHYQANPIHTIKTNTIGVINMLEFAKKHGARILQASTSEIYGNPLEHPQKETYFGNVNPIGPRSCYDEGKRLAEALFFEYHRAYGIETHVARIFNTYGPNMARNDGRVVSNFIIQALEGKEITIYGDGSQTRSFWYVDDLVEGLVALMESSEIGPINLGNPAEYTIKEIAEKVILLTGSRSRIVERPLPEDDPKKRKPDIALAKTKLGWEPHTALEEGLTATIRYFQSKGSRKQGN
jgi:UDP-glucuronate decarboxylase